MTDAAGRVRRRYPAEGGRRRAQRRRSLPGCLAVLVALAVVVGGFYVGVTRGVAWVSDQFGERRGLRRSRPRQGDLRGAARATASAAIGRNLKDAGVVASVDACIEAATRQPRVRRRSRSASTS